MRNYDLTLGAALSNLAASALPPKAMDALGSGAEIGHELRAAILADIPAFNESRNPDVVPDLIRHSAEHATELLRLLRGGPIGDFAFVREHAERRAEQRFPLEAVLHAYRCGHKVFAQRLRGAALAAISSAEHAQRAVAALAVSRSSTPTRSA